MLKITDISNYFGKRKILDDINLDIKEKSIITITGKSGSGKTTLLGIISGLLKPKKGKVLYKGKNILKWSDFRRSRFRNREVGFVFQFFNLLPDLTSYQNIIYPALIGVKNSRDDIKKRADELIDYLGISEIRDHYPPTLSGGERQRVAIARAIINRPGIILADEPTGNLDDLSATDIINLFKKLKDEGITLIIVSHDQRLVDISDEHYILKDAKLHLQKGKTKKRVSKATKTKRVEKKKSGTTIKKTVKKKKTAVKSKK